MSGAQGAVAGMIFVAVSAITVYAMLQASTHANNSPARVRLVTIHRYGGYVFLLLFCVMSYFMTMRLKGLAEKPSAHLTVHMLFAFLIAPLLVVKVLIARYYKQHHSALLPLGLSIFAISFALVGITLVPHFLGRFESGRLPAVWTISVLVLVTASFGCLAVFRPHAKEPSLSGRKTNAATLVPSNRRASGMVLQLARIKQQGRDSRTLRFLVQKESRLEARAGQFLTFRWALEGREVPRSYSICSSPSQTAYVEIAPKLVANGYVSKFLNTDAAVGLTVEATGPFGEFYFDETKHEHLLLVAGGSGITPMLSILRYIDDRCLKTPATLIYCVRSREDILFEAEFLELQSRLDQFRFVVVLSQPDEDWMGAKGRINRDIIAAQCVDLSSVTAFLCGPPLFMDHVQEIIKALGVSQDHIKRESFGAADLKQHSRNAESEPIRFVEFARSRAVWDVPQGATLLEVAESNAIEIPFSCRQGQCGTCATRLIEGQVDMCCEDGLSPAQKTAGFVLMCVARPRSNVKVEA